MAENRIKQNIYSGVKVTDNISFTIPKKTFIPDFIPIILIAFCGSAGIIYSFITMFQIEISREFINIYIALTFTLFCVIFILPKKFMLSLIPIFVIYETLLYKNWNTYVKGFMLIYNQVYSIIWPRRSDYFRLELSEVNIENAKSVFMGFSLFLIIMIICYVTIVKPNFFFGFLITFPLIEIGLYYGKSPSLFPAFMVIIYWTVLLSVQQSGYYRNIGRSKTGFIRKGNCFIVKPLFKYRTAGQSGILLMLGSFLIIGLTFLIFNKSGYSRSEKINTVRDNLITAFNEFTFEDVKGSIERISESFDLGNVKVYNHRLGNQYSVSFNNKTDLIVTCDEAFIPNGNIYLKGYVGSIYDGKSWNEHNSRIYNDNRELFNNSRSRPQDFLYKSISRLNESSNKNYNLDIEVCFRNARYNYTPYNSLPNGEVNYINDTIIDLADKINYSFKISEDQNFNRFLEQNNFTDSKLEGYEEFVYENYLEVPNNNEINQLYNAFIKDDVSVDIYKKLNNIKKILSENAEYTLEPGKTPSGRDFVNYFLTENHKGYCVHFATSGVILARMSGIPARYAEGYVITEDDFSDENLTLNGYKIEIKDNRAHAWAEIYLKDFGWIPFEFTPSSAAAFTNTQSQDALNITTTHTETTKVKENISISIYNKNTENNINTTVKLTHIQDNTQTTDSSERLSNNYRLSIEALLIITVIIIILLTILIIVLIHLFIIKKRRKSFNTKNYSENSLNAYKYILKLLDFCGIKNDNMQYIEFAQYAELKSKDIFRSNEFIEATKIALEAKLSSQEISKTKSETVIVLAYKISDKIYRKQNFFIRLYMKYLKNLC